MKPATQAFAGFTLPDGAWLPPEFLIILPEIRTLAELKVTIAAIYQTAQIGGTAPISLSDFQALTGLERKSVTRGINAATARGTILRAEYAGTYIYSLSIKEDPASTRGMVPLPRGGYNPRQGDKSTPGRGNGTQDRGIESPNRGKGSPNRGTVPLPDLHACNTNQTTDLPDSENIHAEEPEWTAEQRRELLLEMRALGVALRVAQSITGRYKPDYVAEKLRQARYAVEAGLANNGPGWFVASIRQNWGTPLGYDPDAHLTDEERRLRYITGEFADLIQH